MNDYSFEESQNISDRKKHFQHYRRFPQIAYIPIKKEFFSIIKMLKELNIKVVII